MDDTRAYFDRVAAEWDRMRQDYFPEQVREEVLRRAGPSPQMSVADVGCGTGFLAAAFAPLVAEVHCIDASAAMLSQARQRLAGYGHARYHVADGASLPLPDSSVDLAVANMYLHHTAEPAQAIAEMARILRPGGTLILTDLDAHSEEWMRAEMADRWLGFPRVAVQEWLTRAGLQEVQVGCCGST